MVDTTYDKTSKSTKVKRCGMKFSYHSYIASYGNNVHKCAPLMHIPTTTFQGMQQRLKRHLLQAYQQIAKQTCQAHPNNRHHRSGSDTHLNKWTQSNHIWHPEGRNQHWCHKVGISTKYNDQFANINNKKILHWRDNTNECHGESKPRDPPPMEIPPERHKTDKMKSSETSTQVSNTNTSSPNNDKDIINKEQINQNLKNKNKQCVIQQAKLKDVYYNIIKEWEKQNKSKTRSQSLWSILKNLNKTSDLAQIKQNYHLQGPILSGYLQTKEGNIYQQNTTPTIPENMV